MALSPALASSSLPSARSFFQRVRRVTSYGSLVQFRAYLLIAFILYLLLGPVSAETDIVAAVFCYALLGILFLISIITVAGGRTIRRSLDLQLIDPSSAASDDPGDAGGAVISGAPSGLALRVPPVAVPPFFVLYLRLEIDRETLVIPLHQVTGKTIAPSILSEGIVFPHRGLWEVERVRVQFGDQFGFTRDHWEVDTPAVARTITVRPPPLPNTTLPVLSSSFRSGEMMVDAVENRGELFDIKRYHSSDGMQRIIWKIYARRGELMSRHPERAVTPEGQIVAFVLARPEDDHSAAEALAYLRYMEDLELLTWTGCQGMGRERAARSSKDAEKLLIETAWAAGESSPASIRTEMYALIDEVRRALFDAALERVLLFCSAERVASVEGAAECIAAGEALAARAIAPVFIVSSKKDFAPRAARPSSRSGWRARAERILLHSEGGAPERPSAAAASRELARVCAARRWELILS